MDPGSMFCVHVTRQNDWPTQNLSLSLSPKLYCWTMFICILFIVHCFISSFAVAGRLAHKPNEIPLGNKRTDCSLDLFVDGIEINFLATLVNGILITVYHDYFNVRYLFQTLFSFQELFVQVV